jgi:exonuclease III
LINEHWINKSEIDILKMHGFVLMSYFARVKYLRGGVLILGKKQLDFKKVGFKSTYFEIAGISVQIGTDKIVIVSIYRPSNPKSDLKLDKFFEDIEKSMEKILINLVQK